ncbi:MAG: D-2-hydroxyacid dehydrogenase [Gemmataceae bacterium]|nr:D-2-hydroxyacid dehydrogenase [Gemmataceae bacterium]
MDKPRVLILAWLPDGVLDRLIARFPGCEFLDARDSPAFEHYWPGATITYGLPPVARLAEAPGLRWVQLISAGVPPELCPAAQDRGVIVTNLAGLYGPSIAEHALALMMLLVRNLHTALRHQTERLWDRNVAQRMGDLHGKTLAVVGLGNIGQHIARLGRAHGMRVVGCRRRPLPTPFADQVYPCSEMPALLDEADLVAVAAPLTRHTEGMLGAAEFRAMKPGAFYVNVSRGGVAQEAALLEALRSGHLAGAGLDVFAVEPLPPDHPFWTMPQVIVSPHYSGEAVNNSALPSERFARNLHAWLNAGRPAQGVVDLEWGY